MVEQAIALREHMSTRRDVARGMASGPRLPAARKRRIVEVERIATGGEDRAGCVVRRNRCEYKSLSVLYYKALTKPHPASGTSRRPKLNMLYQMDLFGKPASEEPTYYRSAHKAAYPGTSKSSKSRLIETHTNSLKHLLAKDGVIYKEATAIVAEDIK